MPQFSTNLNCWPYSNMVIMAGFAQHHLKSFRWQKKPIFPISSFVRANAGSTHAVSNDVTGGLVYVYHLYFSRESCQKGLICHALAWRVGPFGRISSICKHDDNLPWLTSRFITWHLVVEWNGNVTLTSFPRRTSVTVSSWINVITELQKSCSRCNKNTRHVESSYILQPPKYLLLFVNRFRYINNNVTKYRCPIPMDTTIRLGLLKFSLEATIDHHGPYIHSGHYTASINCCKKKKTFCCNDHTITEFGITDTNSSTAYVILYKLIDVWFLDSNRRVGVW